MRGIVLVVCIVSVCAAHGAHAAGCEWGEQSYSTAPAPYGPEPPDPVADDCALHDLACIAAHNERVLTLALLLSDPNECTRSTRPKACRAVYAMTLDDSIELPPITECTWIHSVDHGAATVLMPLSGRVAIVVARPGWKPRTYLGDCSALPKGFSAPEVRR